MPGPPGRPAAGVGDEPRQREGGCGVPDESPPRPVARKHRIRTGRRAVDAWRASRPRAAATPRGAHEQSAEFRSSCVRAPGGCQGGPWSHTGSRSAKRPRPRPAGAADEPVMAREPTDVPCSRGDQKPAGRCPVRPPQWDPRWLPFPKSRLRRPRVPLGPLPTRPATHRGMALPSRQPGLPDGWRRWCVDGVSGRSSPRR